MRILEYIAMNLTSCKIQGGLRLKESQKWYELVRMPSRDCSFKHPFSDLASKILAGYNFSTGFVVA